jgi:Leucine-rich repeat (LRR) protein
MKSIFLILALFSFDALAQVNRFWNNPGAYPADLNRAWVETQGNCDRSNKAALSIVKSRSTTLSMEERGMPLSNILDLMMTMPNFPNVNSLDLRNAKFDDDDLNKLNQLAPRMTSVTDVYLGGSSVSDKRTLINLFLFNLANKIQILDLSNMKLDESDTRMLGGVIASMKNLRVLYLSNNNFGDAAFDNLINHSLNTLKKLQILGLSNNNLSSKSISRFAMSAMPQMTNLQILDLKGNEIDAESTKKIIRTSLILPELAVLDLDSNLSPSGQKRITSFLKCSTYSSGVFADQVE